jgi:hypothetical protein
MTSCSLRSRHSFGLPRLRPTISTVDPVENWEVVATLAGVAALVIATLLVLLQIPSKIRAALILVGPIVAVAAFAIADPDGSCQRDCTGRAAWAIITGTAVAGWFIGAGLPIQRLIGR